MTGNGAAEAAINTGKRKKTYRETAYGLFSKAIREDMCKKFGGLQAFNEHITKNYYEEVWGELRKERPPVFWSRSKSPLWLLRFCRLPWLLVHNPHDCSVSESAYRHAYIVEGAFRSHDTRPPHLEKFEATPLQVLQLREWPMAIFVV